jgi:putative hydrolase of the HAD superfamily
MPIRAVIFDLGGVILGSPPQAFRAYEAERGIEINFLNRMIMRNGAKSAWARLERGELDMARFMVELDAEAAAEGVQISTADLMERVALASAPRPEMVEVVRTIRARGLRVAALTNNWASEDQSGKMNLLRGEFDVFIESVIERVRKPDPRIYELACERLGVVPVEAVFLDDLGPNLKPARAMGMTTIKVDAIEDAVNELERVLGFALRGA